MTLLSLTLMIGTASAQQPSGEAPSAEAVEQAKQLFRNGATLYEEGNYEEAIKAFQLAYELSKNPKLLFNIANALERKGDLVASYDTLNSYRVFASDDERVTIERRMRSLEERIAIAKVLAPAPAPAPASVGIAPVPVAPVPVPVPVPMPPAPGFALVPIDEVQGSSGSPTKWVLFGVGTGVASAFGTATLVTYSVGRGLASDGDQDSYETVQLLNNVSLGVTSAAATAAIIGLLIPQRRPEPVETTTSNALSAP